MIYDISWAGRNVSNHGSRLGMQPAAIVNHISAGSMGSMLNTFENPANKCSSHYGISRGGEIVQYVKLERGAWTQGITADKYGRATAPIVREKNCNPNLYSISIEYEGYIDKATGERCGIDGDITEEQFWSGAWLHRFILESVRTSFGVAIPLNPYTVLGHFQIDPVGKPVCPGPKFPWARMHAELAAAGNMTLEAYEERISYFRGNHAQTAHIVALVFRVDDLVSKLAGPWSAEAQRKMDRLTAILERYGFAQEGVSTDQRIKGLYETWRGQGPHANEAFRKLNLVATDAKNEGLM